MAHDFGVDLPTWARVFGFVDETTHRRVVMSQVHMSAVSDTLGIAIRRSYISDEQVRKRQVETGHTAATIVASKLPDPGSTMSGDFGEILTAILQASREHPTTVLDSKKWRLKPDRNKPVQGADVVQMVFSDWPRHSAEDRLICCEVKTKATSGSSQPLRTALEDSRKDSDGRIAKTLVWLREKSIDPGLGSISHDQISRFINTTDEPLAHRDFHAVVVLSEDLVDAETLGISDYDISGRTLTVVSVPDLKQTYEEAYQIAALSSDALERKQQ